MDLVVASKAAPVPAALAKVKPCAAACSGEVVAVVAEVTSLGLLPRTSPRVHTNAVGPPSSSWLSPNEYALVEPLVPVAVPVEAETVFPTLAAVPAEAVALSLPRALAPDPEICSTTRALPGQARARCS